MKILALGDFRILDHIYRISAPQSKNAVCAFQITCKLLLLLFFLPWKILEEISKRPILFIKLKGSI